MKKSRKGKKRNKVVDVKKAAAHDVDQPEVKLPARNASSVRKGAMYAVLAGRPSKQAVVGVFGKTGYALSWVARAEKLGIPAEELCSRFKNDPDGIKLAWDELVVKKAQNQKAQ